MRPEVGIGCLATRGVPEVTRVLGEARVGAGPGRGGAEAPSSWDLSPRCGWTPEARWRAPVPVRRGTAARASGTSSRGSRRVLTVAVTPNGRMRRREAGIGACPSLAFRSCATSCLRFPGSPAWETRGSCRNLGSRFHFDPLSPGARKWGPQWFSSPPGSCSSVAEGRWLSALVASLSYVFHHLWEEGPRPFLVPTVWPHRRCGFSHLTSVSGAFGSGWGNGHWTKRGDGFKWLLDP